MGVLEPVSIDCLSFLFRLLFVVYKFAGPFSHGRVGARVQSVLTNQFIISLKPLTIIAKPLFWVYGLLFLAYVPLVLVFRPLFWLMGCCFWLMGRLVIVS